jgi:hypothetical protein
MASSLDFGCLASYDLDWEKTVCIRADMVGGHCPYHVRHLQVAAKLKNFTWHF